jgi:hypothetical protein
MKMNKNMLLAVAAVGAFFVYKQTMATPKAGRGSGRAQPRSNLTVRPQTEMNQQQDLWNRIGRGATALWSKASTGTPADVVVAGYGRNNPLDARDAVAWGYTSGGSQSAATDGYAKQDEPSVDSGVLDARDARAVAASRNETLDARDAWARRAPIADSRPTWTSGYDLDQSSNLARQDFSYNDALGNSLGG